MKPAERMKLALEILQVPLPVLQDRVAQELEENPVLEFREGDDNMPSEEAIRDRVVEELTENPVLKLYEGDGDIPADDGPAPVPEVVVELTAGGDYEVRLLEDRTASLCVSPRYIELSHDPGADAKAREYLRRKIEAAQWLIECIETRRSTLLRVARLLVAYQTDYLTAGPAALKPLTADRLADELGIHATTVRSAVQGKHMQTPRGTLALESFLSAS